MTEKSVCYPIEELQLEIAQHAPTPKAVLNCLISYTKLFNVLEAVNYSYTLLLCLVLR